MPHLKSRLVRLSIASPRAFAFLSIGFINQDSSFLMGSDFFFRVYEASMSSNSIMFYESDTSFRSYVYVKVMLLHNVVYI